MCQWAQFTWFGPLLLSTQGGQIADGSCLSQLEINNGIAILVIWWYMCTIVGIWPQPWGVLNNILECKLNRKSSMRGIARNCAKNIMNSFPVVLNKLHWIRNLRLSVLPVIASLCINVKAADWKLSVLSAHSQHRFSQRLWSKAKSSKTQHVTASEQQLLTICWFFLADTISVSESATSWNVLTQTVASCACLAVASPCCCCS